MLKPDDPREMWCARIQNLAQARPDLKVSRWLLVVAAIAVAVTLAGLLLAVKPRFLYEDANTVMNVMMTITPGESGMRDISTLVKPGLLTEEHGCNEEKCDFTFRFSNIWLSRLRLTSSRTFYGGIHTEHGTVQSFFLALVGSSYGRPGILVNSWAHCDMCLRANGR